MSNSSATNTQPETTETGGLLITQDPTPAQAAAMQAAKAKAKGKENIAGRTVSNVVEEKKGRQYSPYQKRDKEGEGSNENASQSAQPQRRNPQQGCSSRAHPVAPATGEPQQPPANTNPPVAPPQPTSAPPPLPQTQHPAANKDAPIAQLPVPLLQTPAAPTNQPPAAAAQGDQGAAIGVQDVEMGHTAEDGRGDEMAIDWPDNPHLQTTRMLPLATLPPRPGKGYAGGPYPRIVISSEDLFKSIRTEILHNILEDPLDFLLILPYGAGRRLHSEFPNMGDDILEYIKEFRAPNCERLSIVKAATDTNMKGKKPKMYSHDFEAPWVFILTGFSPELRDFLLGVGVFDFIAGEANHAFSVLKVQANLRSWHVAYLAGDGIASDLMSMNEGLVALKRKIRENDKVRTSVLECYAGRTEFALASTDDKVDDALSTFAITFTTEGNQKYWHLTAKPITDDPGLHTRWIEAIRSAKNFVIGKVFAFDIVHGFKRCDFCKNESHPESACPLPKVAGWKGPKPSEVRERWARIDSRDEERKEGWKRSNFDGPHRGGRGRGQQGGRELRGRGRGGNRRHPLSSQTLTHKTNEKTEERITMHKPEISPHTQHKRKRDEANTTPDANGPRETEATSSHAKERRADERDFRVEIRRDKGQSADQRPKKKRKEYVPCLPPTIRNDEAILGLTVEWTVAQRTVWEGERRRDIVEVTSPFAEQVRGAVKTTNPHWTSTKPSPPLAKDLACDYPITLAAFPNVVLPEATTLGNVRKEVAKELRDNPERYLALIPFGAGNRLFEEARGLTLPAADLINALANEDKQYAVAAPAREGEPPHNARFAKPFAMILKDPSPNIRTKLLNTKTLAFRINGRGFAFSIAEIGKGPKSWVICNLKGSAVSSEPQEMTKALKAIASQILESTGLRTLANRILGEENVGRTAEERAQVAIGSMSLIYIERGNEHGYGDPVWQLHGRPLSRNDKENKEWLRAIRQVTFFVDATTVLQQEREPARESPTTT
ncbi:hypothetical protein PLEOSDRAFT_165058 [Pleurotus ostreatus PC15]|uniref:Uncharacterized protein n=1 Tax=Pleurotus ostreatus (strain PC15) TaxID=1137138 RepID=A0A067NZV8_PLEO1|nr:hypothetical protein PLEOSDRAFT_165058 [Pleurotus ostreatus PC15]